MDVETEWRCHPSLPLEANAAGEIRYKGKLLPHRADADGYRISTFGPRRNPKTVKVHRVVLACFEGEKPYETDHLDRNRANNAYRNLRYATVSQNRGNVGVRRQSASGIRCVRRRDRVNPWQAYTTRGGKWRSLGHFATLDEARAVAEKHYGDS